MTTDNQKHDVGTWSQAERLQDQRRFDMGAIDEPATGAFDTPSLKGLRYSAPYFHDGSAATIEDLLEMTDGSMGNTGHLSGPQKSDLIAYLRSL